MSRASDPRWFYKAVLGFRPKPPKAKGKKKIPKGPKPIQPKKGVKNIIRIFEGSTDLTQDTASQQEWMQANLSELTDEELEKLRNKIGEIAGHIFEDEETNKKIQKLKELTVSEIMVKKSREKKEALRKEIDEKLEQFPELKGPEITDAFVRSHFSDIIGDYEDKIKAGLILPRPEEEDPVNFVKDHIKKRLNL